MAHAQIDPRPTHPGEVLQVEYLEPMGLTQRDLARALHVPYQRVNELVRGKRGVTPSTALRLARFLGAPAEYWLSLQASWDLYYAQQDEESELEEIKPGFTKNAIYFIIRRYTREAGVRNLEREISSICRKLPGMLLKTRTRHRQR